MTDLIEAKILKRECLYHSGSGKSDILSVACPSFDGENYVVLFPNSNTLVWKDETACKPSKTELKLLLLAEGEEKPLPEGFDGFIRQVACTDDTGILCGGFELLLKDGCRGETMTTYDDMKKRYS